VRVKLLTLRIARVANDLPAVWWCPAAPRCRAAASPAGSAVDGNKASRVESELGEIKALLAEVLRSPSGSRSPGAARGYDA
jgi:hypothetical protein